MELIRIGKAQWDVLAVCDERGGCPVLDVLDQLSSDYPAAVRRMFSLLRGHVPEHGPQGLRAPTCKPLGNGLWEFRKEPKGRRLRVVWFYDFGRVVVCTVAFSKAERTPRGEIARSERMRLGYLEGRRNGTNRIVNDD